VGLDGQTRCHALGSDKKVFLGDRAYFRNAITQRRFVVGSYALGRLAGKPVITFAQPVIGADDKVTGVVFASVDLAEMAKSVAGIQLPSGAALGIHDRDGALLAGKPALPIQIGKKVLSPVLREAVKTWGTGVREGVDGAGHDRVWAFMPSSPHAEAAVFVAVSLDRDLVLGPSRTQLWLELAVLALVAFLGGWVAWMIGGSALVAPTRQILHATRELEKGNLNVRIPVLRSDAQSEFSRIAVSFNLMADSLEQRKNDLEKELTRSRQAYATLDLTINSMQEGVMAVDILGRVLLMNEAASRLFVLDQAPTVLSRQWPQHLGLFVPGTDTLYAVDELPLHRALQGKSGGPLHILVRNAAAPEGRLISASYRPMQGPDGIVGALMVFSDITQLEQLQMEQTRSYEQLRLLETAISRLNDIVLISEIDPLDKQSRRIVFVNDAFERCTGYSREEVLGKSAVFLRGPNTRGSELDRIRAALRKMEPVRAELTNYRKNGEEFWLELDIVPIADAKGVFTHWVAVERDITERKLSEQALIDGEQRYAALFKSAPVPMWIVDAQTLKFLAVNETTISGYGYSRDEFLQLTLFDIRPRAEQERLKHYVAKGFTGAPTRWLHVRKDGLEFPVETVSRVIHYLGREARFVVAINITAQVKAENDVQAYLFTLQRAADATQAITRQRTLEAAMQETVDQARAVVGAHQAVVSLTAREGGPQAINAVSLSDKYANGRDFVKQSYVNGIYSLVCETNSPMRLTQAELEALPHWRDFGDQADNKHPPMRGWLAVPLTGRNGENIGLLQLTDKYEGEFTLQDQYVSAELAQLASIAIENVKLFEQVHRLNLGLEEKVAERTAALARQEALFRALTEQAPQIIWNVDADGKVIYLNRRWYELMGGTPADWLGYKWMTAVHPDDLDDMSANWEASRRSLTPYVGMRRFLAKDGAYHAMSYRASPVLDDNGSVLFWVGIDADVTEIKEIETALRLSNQELEAFSYSVSHDLRSPLNTVDGFSRLLARQLGADNPNEKVQHYLARIQAGVAQMGQLIEDLLSLAQVSRMQLRHETVDLSAIAHEIADECQGRNPERVARISIEDGLQVQGDGRLIRVLIENLFGNAWKFTSQRDCAEIRVGRKIDAAGTSTFFVQDNGAGFDMAYADKLFNTFQRLHAATEFPGTGVGLATVSRVVGRHRGQVWAESGPGKGATFFFTLPGAIAVP
jgi:PAS domain S-box-containing protein